MLINTSLKIIVSKLVIITAEIQNILAYTGLRAFKLYVTLEHKTSHKGQFFKTAISKSYES